jgi:signal transduction histidine kinase
MRANEELRATETTLRMQHQVNQDILSAQSSTAVAQAALSRIRQLIGCGWAAVLLFDMQSGMAHVPALDAEGPTRLAAGDDVDLAECAGLAELGPGEVSEIENLAAPDRHAAGARARLALSAEGAGAYLGVPLAAGGQLIGALCLWRIEPGRFAPETVNLAREAADSLAVAMHHAALFELVSAGRARLQEMSRRLVQAQEQERQAIARELHDEAGQSLTALMIGLGVLERDCQCFSEESHWRIAELKRTTDEVMEGLHRLSRNLRPASLDRLGLLPAIRQHIRYFEQETGMKVELVAVRMDRGRLSPELETTLYRVVQEALTNIARHAGASRARVVLKRRAERAIAIVEDNGAGFDPAAAAQSGRLGLLGMRERTELLGGRLTIDSAPGQGTKVFAEIPL